MAVTQPVTANKADSAEQAARSPELWLIVPVKPFAEAKSRLAEVLSPDERAALMQTLFGRVLAAARASELFGGMLVISRDYNVLAMAEAQGAIPVQEQGNDLNSALEEARAALPSHAEALLVLPADLPEITAEGLVAFLRTAEPVHGESLVAIAPSVTGGTNALLLVPPDVIPFAFGVEAEVESADRHAQLAMERGARLATIKSSALVFDVDLPADYLVFRES